jgi:hypothetical protein
MMAGVRFGEPLMSRTTVYLARFIGLFALFAVGAVFVRGPAVIDASLHDAPLMLTYGMISLGAGLALVVGHNVWTGGLTPVVVTLVGWLSLAKGVFLSFFPPDALGRAYASMDYGTHARLYLAPALVVGIYLTVAGFLAKAKE